MARREGELWRFESDEGKLGALKDFRVFDCHDRDCAYAVQFWLTRQEPALWFRIHEDCHTLVLIPGLTTFHTLVAFCYRTDDEGRKLISPDRKHPQYEPQPRIYFVDHWPTEEDFERGRLPSELYKYKPRLFGLSIAPERCRITSS